MQLISEAKQGQAWGKGSDYKTFRSEVTVTACGGVHELACHCWTREGYSSLIVSDHGGNIQLNLSSRSSHPGRETCLGGNMKHSKEKMCVLILFLLL